MKVRVQVKEISWGAVIVDVPDNATEDEVYEKAHDSYCEGNVFWNNSDFDVIDWEKDE